MASCTTADYTLLETLAKKFLPRLNVRGKWFSPKRNLREEDVVLVVDSQAHREEWPLGRMKLLLGQMVLYG